MEELISIVNESDELIGYKERSIAKRDYIYRVSSLWITYSKGEILLARRAGKKDYDAGKWGPAVAETVRKDESYHDAIIRGSEEELGFNNIKPSLGPKFRLRSGQRNYFCQFYFLDVNKKTLDFKLQKEEVAEVRWFSRKKILGHINLYPTDFIGVMQEIVKVLMGH